MINTRNVMVMIACEHRCTSNPSCLGETAARCSPLTPPTKMKNVLFVCTKYVFSQNSEMLLNLGKALHNPRPTK